MKSAGFFFRDGGLILQFCNAPKYARDIGNMPNLTGSLQITKRVNLVKAVFAK